MQSCERCGKEHDRGSPFCSDECRFKTWRANKALEKKRLWWNITNCLACGKLLPDDDGYRRKYCDRRCLKKAGRLRRFANVATNPEKMVEMVSIQNCEICGRSREEARQGELCFDHDHGTNALRGVLCHRCNMLIGQFEDRPELLEMAAAYLRKRSRSEGPSMSSE